MRAQTRSIVEGAFWLCQIAVVTGLVMLVIACSSNAPARSCTTDTDCMRKYGGDGGPGR